MLPSRDETEARHTTLSLATIYQMASSAGGSDLFQSYEQDFQTVSDGIRQKIDQQIPSQTGGMFLIYTEKKKKSSWNLCRAT